MSLTVQEQILIEQRVANEGKSTGVAYLLWFFLGGFAAHRFYLGKRLSATVMLLLSLAGWLLIFVGIGIVFLIPVGIWLIIDLFLMPGMVSAQKEKVRQNLQMQFLVTRPGGDRDNVPAIAMPSSAG